MREVWRMVRFSFAGPAYGPERSIGAIGIDVAGLCLTAAKGGKDATGHYRGRSGGRTAGSVHVCAGSDATSSLPRR